MDLSIIIINYNTFDLTGNCINSVFSKTDGITFEIILVDNASDERDPQEFLTRFPSVHLIKSKKNVGFAKGNNLGIQVAKGDFVLLLNSDTCFLNNAATIALSYLKGDEELGVVSSALYYPDGTLQHNCQRFPSIKVRLFELLRLQKLIPKKISSQVLLGSFFDHKRPVQVDWTWGTFFLFRKEHLKFFPEQKLDDEYFMYGEDMQWCFEFRKQGLQIGFCPEAKVTHYMGMSNGPKSEMMEQNLNSFLVKNYPTWKIYVIRLLDKLLAA